MKGVTNQPLVVIVADEWYQHPAMLELMAKGHTVHRWSHWQGTNHPDLILHPAAHAWHDALWDYLPAAIRAARRRRKENK